MTTEAVDPYMGALRALMEAYGPTKAALSAERRDSEGIVWHFTVQSQNPRAASLGVWVDRNGLILLSAGFTSFEMWAGHYGDAQQIVDLVEVCEAVLKGEFEELVISSGEHILYTRGTFHLKDRPFKAVRSQTSWRWILPKTRQVHRYDAY